MGRSTRAVAAAGLVLALPLGVAAVQSLRAALTTINAAETIDAVRRGEPRPPAEITAARGASVRAAGLADAGRYLTDAALADAALAPAGRRDAALAIAALRVHPASPHNWMRLSLARLDAGDPRGARAAWTMSVDTGRSVDRLLAPRVDAGIRLLGPGEVAFVELLADQVRLLAATDRAALDAIAERRRAIPFVRAVLRTAR